MRLPFYEFAGALSASDEGVSRRPNSAGPPVVVEVSEFVETPLQFFRPVPLLLGHFASRNISTPAKVGLGIRLPRRASKAALETPIGVSLNLRNARVDFAVCSFALHVTGAITAIETEGHSASSRWTRRVWPNAAPAARMSTADIKLT